MYVPTAISVGSGGCIFGLLGAMHVDIVFSVIHEHFLKKRNAHDEEQEEDEEDKENEDDDYEDEEENALLLDKVEAEVEGNKEQHVEKEGDPLQHSYVLRSSYIILGFLGGVSVTTLMGILYPQSLKMQKDWAVLYGGMMSGLIVSLVWQFCTAAIRARKRYMVNRIFFAFLIVVVPFAFDCYFSLEVTHSLLKIM